MRSKSIAAFGMVFAAIPANAAIQYAVDLFEPDFYPNYTNGNIVGQLAGPGFTTTWSGVAATVGGGVVASGSGTGRTSTTLFARNEFNGLVGDSGGTTFYFRARMALSVSSGFKVLELADNDGPLVQLGDNGFGVLGVFSWNGSTYTDVQAPGLNDGQFHEWLVAIDTVTGQGRVWVDAITSPSGLAGNFNPSVGGTAFSASPGFQLKGINLGSFGDASVTVDHLIVGGDWEGLLLTVVPEPSSAALLGLGALSLLRRRRA